MSDFLGRLAERALGIGQVVQPRLGPLFAPSVDLGGERPDVAETSAPRQRDVVAAAPMAPAPPVPVEGSTATARHVPDVRVAAPRTAAMEEPPSLVEAPWEETPPARRSRPDATIVQAASPAEPPLLLPAHRAAPAPGVPEQLPIAAGAPPAPPTVRVTIGRVEVRAVFPAPEPSRPAPSPPPRLTLAEYLKQRREGAR